MIEIVWNELGIVRDMGTAPPQKYNSIWGGGTPLSICQGFNLLYISQFFYVLKSILLKIFLNLSE